MRKLVGFLAGLLAVMLIAFCGCNTEGVPEIPERPEDTNLEFWIMEDVTDKGYEWEGHYHEILGSAESCLESYWGTGYEPVIDENGVEISPKYCVFYIPKTLYTDSGSKRVISAISITDPKVTVYGLTVDSTFEEFDAVFRNMGYKIEIESYDYSINPYIIHLAKAKGIRFQLRVYTDKSQSSLQIVANVS